jgi:hypothetical protein
LKSSSFFPVILISFDRGAMLERTIGALERQTVPVEVVVHDNGSTDPATLEVLDRLERRGTRVFRYPPITSPEELDLVDQTVKKVSGRRSYAVSDCDVSLEDSDPRAIEFYLHFLDREPAAACVGPMLRIEDIPSDYPLFGKVINRHVEQFWHKEPLWTEALGRTVAYQWAPIDTTLAVHRSGSRFHRLKQGIRLYRPFDALHLDWYPHDSSPSYWQQSAPGISHWSNAAYRDQFAAEPPTFDEYVIVVESPDGTVCTSTRRVADHPVRSARHW